MKGSNVSDTPIQNPNAADDTPKKKAKIREKDRTSVLNAIAGGVTPRRGIQFIQVGRRDEIAAILSDIEHVKSGGGAARIIQANFGSGKTFLLTLSKTVALKQNMVVINADLSPDRRLYSSSGQAQALYRELVRSMSTATTPDGGALEELLDAFDARVMSSDAPSFKELRRLPYGYDAITVVRRWHEAHNPVTDKEKRDSLMVQDACLRWFAGETTTEHKKLLGVKSSIGDDGAYDALKMIAVLSQFAGYSGLLVEFDECINLYNIRNSTSRERNYEQILRIFNECLQGDAPYLYVMFAGVPEFVMDPRRGLFSYEALRSRLVSSEYSSKNNTVDTTGPVINLMPLSDADLIVLLGNITNVEALGKREDWLVEDPEMMKFLKKFFDALGANYYRTPREILREFVTLLRTLRANPGMDFDEALANVEPKKERRESGLGAAGRRGNADAPNANTGGNNHVDNNRNDEEYDNSEIFDDDYNNFGDVDDENYGF